MKNILILDNDLYFANSLKLFLGTQKISCTICDEENDAIEYLKNNIYDIVICSTQLGNKSGLELSMFLKNQMLMENTPLILVTSSNNASMNSYFSELQPAAIVHKPISLPTLLATIKQFSTTVL
jgi:DNA-binding response OmpR family regulator